MREFYTSKVFLGIEWGTKTTSVTLNGINFAYKTIKIQECMYYGHFLKMGVQCMHLLYEYHKVCLISSSYCEIIFLNYSTPGPLGEPNKSMISW